MLGPGEGIVQCPRAVPPIPSVQACRRPRMEPSETSSASRQRSGASAPTRSLQADHPATTQAPSCAGTGPMIR